jgi:hypothetical protein
MIANCRHRYGARLPASLCPVLLLLAGAPSARAQCMEKTVSEFATATSRDAAERNAMAKLAQKLKKLRGDARKAEEKPQVECRQPLMWQCTASVKVCL